MKGRRIVGAVIAVIVIVMIYALLILSFGTWDRALAILLLAGGVSILVAIGIFILEGDDE
ncbi:MAG: hypothetical protein IIZ83_02430 [Oscillospiraceae bacterium]|nr:hypothetical protein [Oscillospiraceae bacterium]